MPRVSTLDKSLTLLEAVCQHQEGIGTRSLQSLLGYNVATVHNIALTFCARGYLRQDSQTRRFFPGVRLMLLGQHPAYLHSITNIASPVVEKIARDLNESVLLSALAFGRIVNLKYIPSGQALRVHEPEDMSSHAYCTASGKVLLAAMPKDELEHYFTITRLEALTPKTLNTPEKLRPELEQIRRQGYACTADEYCEGVSALAVPIHDAWGRTVASIGISAPTVRMARRELFKQSLEAARRGAQTIGQIWSAENREEKSRE